MKRPCVFVIDDQPTVADTVSLVLRQAGCEVTTFYDAAPALQPALELHPDVVVTDYSMPNMDGLALATWLKEHCPTCKVVIISGQAGFMAANASSGLMLLQKPVDPGTLIEAVKGEWRDAA